MTKSKARKPRRRKRGGQDKSVAATGGQPMQHVDKDRILAEIKALSVEPFQHRLAYSLQFTPTPEAYQKFVDKSPDRHAQELTMLRGMAGYKKDGPVVNNLWVMIQGMSDLELRNRLVELEGELTQSRSLPETVTIEAEKSLDKA